jgi:hypothetical protein
MLLLPALAAAGPAPAAAAEPAALLQKAQGLAQAGQTVEAMEAADQAVLALWERAPLRLVRSVLVEKPTETFGGYHQRADNVYPAQKATILAYLEPQCYRFARRGELWSFGLSADVYLLNPAGEVLFGKERFITTSLTSRQRVRDFFLNVTLNLSGAPPGDYVVRLVVKDQNGPGSAETRLPIVLK